MPDTHQALEDITVLCHPCQRMQTISLRFRNSASPINYRFNECILIDTMCLYGNPALHIIYEGRHFNTAKLVSNI